MSHFAKRLARLGFDSYDAYLRSPGWRERRGKVLAAAEGRCACGAPAEQVHHRTYTRLGRESLSDLHAVCGPCHAKIHEYVDQGSALEAATMAVLEGSDFVRHDRLTEREKRKAKRKRQAARKRAKRVLAQARAAQRAVETAEDKRASVRTAALDETARRIAAIGPQRPEPEPPKKLTKAERRGRRKDPNFKPNRPAVGGGLPVKVVRAQDPPDHTETQKAAS